MAYLRTRILAFLLFSLSTPLFSQIGFVAVDKGSYNKNFIEGNLNLYDYEYMQALKYFQFAYQYDSTNANINYKIGQCYLKHPTHKHLAESYLEKAIQNVSKEYRDDEPREKRANVMAYFYLGQSYHLDGRLNEAEKMYDTYESYLNPKKRGDREDVALVEHFKKQVANARQMMQAPVNVKVTNLGDSINSIYNELSPVISSDEQIIYYTRAIPDINGDPSSLGTAYTEQIVTAFKYPDGKWSKPTPLSPYVNTGHEAVINLSPDGQTLIMFRADVGGGDLYYTTFDGKDWAIPQKFGSNINTEFWEPHAAISRDGNVLYFVSDRPGGLGGRDIYKCVKLPNGQWSLAQNLGAPINTQYDEDGPFLGADGITFYYASSSDKSMGGFDIMFSTIDENGKFSDPVNMGYPVNTTDDDVFLVVSPDNKRFYFSSGHEEIYNSSMHEKGFGEEDIYMGNVDIVRENPLALFRGKFVPGPCDSLPDDITIMVTSASTAELIGTYRPNRKTGTFSVIIPPGSKYIFSYQQAGNELYSDEVFVPTDIAYEEIQKAINLKPLKICPGMIVSGDTTQKDITLNVTVLNNRKESKPVQADVKLQQKGEANVMRKTDAQGRTTGIKLKAEKSYELSATAGGKNSGISIFHTIGAGQNKVIEKTIYLEKDVEVSFTVNVAVYNNKTQRKPLAGVKVIIKGTDGSSQEATTNAKGKVTGIVLNATTNYEVDAEKDGAIAARGMISTQGLRKSKTIDKVLYLQGGASEVPDNSEISGDCFTFYFKYNMNEVDESAPEYKKFIDKLVDVKNAGGKISLAVNASASTVPSHQFKSNEDLALRRANSTIEKIKNSLKQKGVTENDILITSNKAVVSGPDYKGDYNNTDKYGKYQYVKACLSK